MDLNKELIFEIIKNNYGYNKDSLSFVYKQLYDKMSDPYIQGLFSSSKNGRIRFLIDERYKENIDDGWRTFKEYFSDFVSEYNITYKDFLENKATIGKGQVKLKKAITNYIIEKTIIDNSLKTYNFGDTIKQAFSGYRYSEDKTENLLTFESADNITSILSRSDEKGNNFIDLNRANLRRIAGPENNIANFIILPKQNYHEGHEFNKILLVGDGHGAYHITANISSNYTYSKIVSITDKKINKLFSNSYIASHFINNKVVYYVLCLGYIQVFELDLLTFSFTEKNWKVAFDYNTIYCDQFNTNIFYGEKNNVVHTLTISDGAFVKVESSVDIQIPTTPSYTTSKFISLINGVLCFANGSTIFLSTVQKKPLLESIIKRIEDSVTKKFEIVGSKTLPKNRKLELVLSINFDDWFLCSTGETWTSCLNLESHHSSCHYQGLPGLLGDPNRVLAYITDGTAKEYEGICVDKILSRTWMLLDENNAFNIIKFYPLELLGVRDFESITKELGVKIKYLGSNFISKNSITPIFFDYKKIGKRAALSSFIFQDKTRFVLKGEEIFLTASSNNSYYSLAVDQDSGKKKIKNMSLFHYDGGMKNLIKSGMKLTNFMKNFGGLFLECCNCGADLEEKGYKEINEEIYCGRCLQELFTSCSICGDFVPREEALEFRGDNICQHCYQERVVECKKCGKKHLAEITVTGVEGSYYNICGPCSRKQNLSCPRCGAAYLNKEAFEKFVKVGEGCVKCLSRDRLQQKSKLDELYTIKLQQKPNLSEIYSVDFVDGPSTYIPIPTPIPLEFLSRPTTSPGNLEQIIERMRAMPAESIEYDEPDHEYDDEDDE